MPRKFKEIDWTSEMPKCDICVAGRYNPVKQGIYDAPTHGGPWANLCTTHMRDHVPANCTIGFKRIPKKIDPGL